MTKKITIPFLLIAAGIISSCGSGKKLTSAETQINELQTRNSELVAQGDQLTANVNSLNKQVSDLTAQNKTLNDQFNSYKKECQANEEALKDVQAAFGELQENYAKLIEKLETALGDFKDKGINVYSKDGVVYVDMQDNLLYKSGSAALSPNGKTALGNLASVLNEYPKLKVIVVGNTDDVKMKGAKDNWTLSTERANGVVRTLRDSYKVDPTRLTAAGKGKYNPIADNTTAEGRAKNRRTEIVLNPDWRRVWESIKKE
jgi:chemotaxis protein MotB